MLALLDDWRRFLEQLAAVFRTLEHELASRPRERNLERAATRLLPLVVDRTTGEDAWYSTLLTVLRWYADATGITDEHVDAMIADVIPRHFTSWVVPDEAAAARGFADLASRIAAGPEPAPAPRDALATWRTIRVQMFEYFRATPLVPVEGDGHARFIETVDRARDPERAERMQAALLLVRDSAARRMPLTVDQLAEWQGVVLGGSAPAPLRTTDAYAKGGRERYAILYNFRDELVAVLDDAADIRMPIAMRAARVYLDVAFFHPFADGNARAARLALDHVLSSAGYAIEQAAPLFTLARAADDAPGTWAFATAVDLLIGPQATPR